MSKVYVDEDKLKEVRSFGTIEADNKSISGYAIVWDNWSVDLGGFIERIMPEAIDQNFLEQQDVVALWQHNDKTGVLARYFKNQKGTLKLSIDTTGLYYSFPVKKSSPLHQEVYEMVRNGEIFSSSFAFIPDEKYEEWERRDDGVYTRTIRKFKKLLDVSPVVRPAYLASTCHSRFYQQHIAPNQEIEAYTSPTETMEMLEKIDEQVKAEIQAKREAIEKEQAFRAYYQDLLDKYLPDHKKVSADLEKAARQYYEEKAKQESHSKNKHWLKN